MRRGLRYFEFIYDGIWLIFFSKLSGIGLFTTRKSHKSTSVMFLAYSYMGGLGFFKSSVEKSLVCLGFSFFILSRRKSSNK